MDILGVDNVLFAVGDVLVARRFYTDILGLSEAFAFAEAGIVGYQLGTEEPGLLIRLERSPLFPRDHHYPVIVNVLPVSDILLGNHVLIMIQQTIPMCMRKDIA